jgi:uncharacterized membrane protein HdeD (DUF308 family)
MSSSENKEATADVTNIRPFREINWPIVLYYIHLHVGALIGIYYVFAEARVITTLFGKFLCLSACGARYFAVARK